MTHHPPSNTSLSPSCAGSIWLPRAKIASWDDCPRMSQNVPEWIDRMKPLQRHSGDFLEQKTPAVLFCTGILCLTLGTKDHPLTPSSPARPFPTHYFPVTVNSAICPTDVVSLRNFSLSSRAPLSKAEWIATAQRGDEIPPHDPVTA